MLDGMRFQARAATTLNERFAYDWHKFTKEQKAMFKGICVDFKSQGGNEYDVAAYFMAIMVDSVSDKLAHAERLRGWIHEAAALIPFMKLEQSKDFVFDVLAATNRETS